ncbi:Rpn family recombination-promoting nuclease/putative transposase [Anaerovibrio lipolyticus]|uniref:Rpn family recombination-promoting nuclease/putative transposase n=1 Tax=Anaerovibrio lipolyticus TaxID=82374 RepID=UPI0023EFB036|nr:Rpn family recombination-promoting nuclease/putative transposase [Anaerovibrio lipolyticus]
MDQAEMQELIGEVQKFCLMDDTFFNCFMSDNIDGMTYVLNVIMGRDDLVLKRIETQHTIPNLYARGVRFDVFATDNEGREYDFEVQNANDGAIPRRARYNSGMMDYRCLSKGADWSELPETYVIFITAKDVLDHNKSLYHINRKIEETETSFEDGAHIIYVNGEYDDINTELGQMLRDFKCLNASEMKSSILADRMRFLKETDEGVAEVCEIMEKYGAKREARGEERGEKRGKLMVVIDLLKDGIISEQVAADKVGMTVDEFKKEMEAYLPVQ